VKPDYLKMLIVEDDRLIGRLIQEYFSSRDTYEFFSCEDGQEAMMLAKRELPDIMITCPS
jgi:DNA-binding response OmpR family regulator